jgi:hypothetical protein
MCLHGVLLNYLSTRANLLFYQSQSQSHIATDGQSVSKSWYRAPSGAHDQKFLLLFDSYGLALWGALSDERTGLSFVLFYRS